MDKHNNTNGHHRRIHQNGDGHVRAARLYTGTSNAGEVRSRPVLGIPARKIAIYSRMRQQRKPRGGLRRILLIMTLVFFFLSLAAVSGIAGGAYAVYASVSENLPDPNKLKEHTEHMSQNVKIYDRNGGLLYEFWDPKVGKRELAHIQDLPPALINATVATEDKNFFTNPYGVDPLATMRAFISNLQGQRIVSGASTITQQLVKNVLLDPEERYEQSYDRKLREAILAFRISKEYSKNDILQLYLNEIFYGNLSYGVEAAAQTYFGVSARDLTLPEAALIAGLPQSPNFYDPFENYTAAKLRQEDVLDLMVEQGYITEEEAEAAKAVDLKPILQAQQARAQIVPIKYPHWVNYVRSQLEQRYGQDLYSLGLRVYTTLDPKIQDIAEAKVREQIDQIRSSNATNSAAIVIDPKTGEILAMVGSYDYYDKSISGAINMSTSLRQPGSTLKPFTYVTAFEKLNWNPGTIVLDRASVFSGTATMPEWRPQNFDNQFQGAVTVRQALARSRNIPAVLALQKIGIQSLLDTLHKAGITTLDDPARLGLTVTLGGGEVRLVDLTYAYSVFANDGVQIGERVPDSRLVPGYRKLEPVAINKITDSFGKVIYEYKPTPERNTARIFRPTLAYEITDILSDDEARSATYGRNGYLKLKNRPAAAKTGTTDDSRDAWTIGYTPDFVVGVWVGNTNDTPMQGVSGGSGAGFIWNGIMEEINANRPVAQFPIPAGLVKTKMSAVTGMLPGPVTPVIVEDLVDQEQMPKQVEPANIYKYLRICASGLLAPNNYPADMTSVWMIAPQYSDRMWRNLSYGRAVTPAPDAWGSAEIPTQYCAPYIPPPPPPTAVPTPQPNHPGQPEQPGQPNHPGQPNQPGQPTPPPAQPGQPNQPPAQPTKPPAQPNTPAQPTVKPNEPAQPPPAAPAQPGH